MLVMSPDLFIIALFTLLAIWLGIGIFSSRLASEANCHKCGEPVSYVMSKRGINDVAFCSSCGVAVSSISMMGEQNDQDGSA